MEPSILLVVDLQCGLVEPMPEAGCRSTPELIANVQRILLAWRQLGWPIIHIVHHDSDPCSPLNKDVHPEGHRPHECAIPHVGEPILLKSVGSAFTDPKLRLAETLTELGGSKAKMIIIGMDGAQCVNDNARGAYDRGFNVSVVADACASFGMARYGFDGADFSAEDTHTVAMSMLANGFAKVLSTDELLRKLLVGSFASE